MVHVTASLSNKQEVILDGPWWKNPQTNMGHWETHPERPFLTQILRSISYRTLKAEIITYFLEK